MIMTRNNKYDIIHSMRKISIIGSGYVGLPVAVGKIASVAGFDLNKTGIINHKIVI